MGWNSLETQPSINPPTQHLVIHLEEGLEVVDFMGGNSLETQPSINPLPPTSLFTLKKV